MRLLGMLILAAGAVCAQNSPQPPRPSPAQTSKEPPAHAAPPAEAPAAAHPAAEGFKALDEKRYADAIAAFEKAVAADEKDYTARFHLALANSLAGNAAVAISGYEKTLELKPGLAEAELNLGLLLTESTDPSRAEPHLRAAIEHKPDSAAAHAALGRVLMAAGRLADAEASFARAIEIDKSYTDNLLELASAFEARKQTASALRLYDQFRDRPGVNERIGNLYLENGKPEEAIAPLEAAVKSGATAANRYALAIAYLRTKQAEKATALFEQAVASEPKNVELRLTYGRALRDQRQFAPAAQQFFEAARLKPDSREAWSELSGMLMMLERYPQAIAAFERVEALGEAGAAVHFFKAIAYDRQKLYKEALPSYEKFLALSNGEHPDEEFKARQRVKVIQKELNR
jgi:tetratricopeptide (TPR) repeat protein